MKTIVISGASSGIGLATAVHFLKLGYHVIGMSRHLPQGKLDYDYVIADLSQEESIKNAVKEVSQLTDKVDILINCAGIGISGALEYTSIEEAMQITQVNLLGQFSLTTKMLPLLRCSDEAKIINIGSVAGELTIPFQTFYTMTKAALHRMSEGLMMELKPFGIQVASVLPGDTKTGFTKHRSQPRIMEDDIYGERIKKSIQKMEHDEQNGMSVDTVVKVIDRLVKRHRMPIQVTVGFTYKLLMFLAKILPKRIVVWILYKMYG